MSQDFALSSALSSICDVNNEDHHLEFDCFFNNDDDVTSIPDIPALSDALVHYSPQADLPSLPNPAGPADDLPSTASIVVIDGHASTATAQDLPSRPDRPSFDYSVDPPDNSSSRPSSVSMPSGVSPSPSPSPLYRISEVPPPTLPPSRKRWRSEGDEERELKRTNFGQANSNLLIPETGVVPQWSPNFPFNGFLFPQQGSSPQPFTPPETSHPILPTTLHNAPFPPYPSTPSNYSAYPISPQPFTTTSHHPHISYETLHNTPGRFPQYPTVPQWSPNNTFLFSQQFSTPNPIFPQPFPTNTTSHPLISNETLHNIPGTPSSTPKRPQSDPNKRKIKSKEGFVAAVDLYTELNPLAVSKRGEEYQLHHPIALFGFMGQLRRECGVKPFALDSMNEKFRPSKRIFEKIENGSFVVHHSVTSTHLVELREYFRSLL